MKELQSKWRGKPIVGDVTESIHAKSKPVFPTTKGCRNLEEEDFERAGGAGVAAGFLDEKVNQCTSLGCSFIYTWLIFRQQQHLSKNGCQEAPRVPST